MASSRIGFDQNATSLGFASSRTNVGVNWFAGRLEFVMAFGVRSPRHAARCRRQGGASQKRRTLICASPMGLNPSSAAWQMPSDGEDADEALDRNSICFAFHVCGKRPRLPVSEGIEASGLDRYE